MWGQKKKFLTSRYNFFISRNINKKKNSDSHADKVHLGFTVTAMAVVLVLGYLYIILAVNSARGCTNFAADFLVLLALPVDSVAAI
jgi:hypothetical protein